MIVQKINTKKVIVQSILILGMIAISIFLFKDRILKDDGDKYILKLTGQKPVEGLGSFESASAVFESEVFKSLKKIGEWPVVIEEVGRENPFLRTRK